MANTTPDNIYYPTRDDGVAPLETVFATLAASVQAALSKIRSASGYTGSTGTNVEGDVIIQHGLPGTPKSVMVTGGLEGIIPTRRTYAAHSITSTSFKVRSYRQDEGTHIDRNQTSFYWFATL